MVGKHGETILIDWGLAKALGRSDHPSVDDERPLVPTSGSDSSETQAGWAVGTPSFMSPEQAKGDLGRIGPRSDVYGLGATLYDLLTGRKPFAGHDRVAIIAAVVEGDFAPPRSVDPTISPALEAICLRAMARRPESRYASARELAEDVERWLADAPVLAWPEPASVRLRRWARRHRPLVAAAAVLMVMTTLGSIGAALLLDRHSRRIEAEQRLTSAARAEADANFLKALDAGDAMLTRVFEERLASVPQMETLRRDLAQDASSFADGLLGQRPRDPSVRLYAAKVFHHAANVERQTNQDDAARGRYRESARLMEGLMNEFPDDPAYREKLAAVLVSEAEMHRLRGRLREAAPHYRRALDLSAPAGTAELTDPDRRSRAEALSSLAVLLNEMCRHGDATGMLEQSVGLWRPLADRDGAVLKDRLMMVITLANFTGVLREAGRPAEAARASDEAIGRARPLLEQAKAGATTTSGSSWRWRSTSGPTPWPQPGPPRRSPRSTRRSPASGGSPPITPRRTTTAPGTPSPFRGAARSARPAPRPTSPGPVTCCGRSSPSILRRRSTVSSSPWSSASSPSGRSPATAPRRPSRPRPRPSPSSSRSSATTPTAASSRRWPTGSAARGRSPPPPRQPTAPDARARPARPRPPHKASRTEQARGRYHFFAFLGSNAG